MYTFSQRKSHKNAITTPWDCDRQPFTEVEVLKLQKKKKYSLTHMSTWRLMIHTPSSFSTLLSIIANFSHAHKQDQLTSFDFSPSPPYFSYIMTCGKLLYLSRPNWGLNLLWNNGMVLLEKKEIFKMLKHNSKVLSSSSKITLMLSKSSKFC